MSPHSRDFVNVCGSVTSFIDVVKQRLSSSPEQYASYDHCLQHCQSEIAGTSDVTLKFKSAGFMRFIFALFWEYHYAVYSALSVSLGAAFVSFSPFWRGCQISETSHA